MSRIKGGNVQLAGSFVVPIEQSAHNKKIQEALDKEKEIILQAEQKAQEILDNAAAQGQQIIEDATNQALSEVDNIKQNAYNEGFEAGRQEGLRDIRNELKDKIVAVDDFATSNFDVKHNIIKSAYSDIIQLIIEISHKICSKSLELDDNILKELTLSAIQALKDKEEITIIVNPEMAEKIYAVSDELRELVPQLESIKIIEDASVSPDGTIVESPLSRVDCRIRSQISEIADKLMAKLDSTPNDEPRPQREIKAEAQEEITEPTIEENAQDETTKFVPEEIPEEITNEMISEKIIQSEAELEAIVDINEEVHEEIYEELIEPETPAEEENPEDVQS